MSGNNPKIKLDQSKRASKGKLVIYKKRCKYCNHDKALENQTFVKCSRCKRHLK